MKLILLSLGLWSANIFAQQQPNNILDCWDGTFAYTTTTIGTFNDQSNLMSVRLHSENQKFLTSFAESPVGGWGEGEISFYINKADCQFTAPTVMNCNAKQASIEVAYDETFESRKILRHVVDNMSFQTSTDGKNFLVDLSTKRLNPAKDSATQLAFPLGFGGRCNTPSQTSKQCSDAVDSSDCAGIAGCHWVSKGFGIGCWSNN